MSGFEKRHLLCNGVFGLHGNIYYVMFDNYASIFQYIMSTLCDTIPEHVFEDNLVNIGRVRGKQEVFFKFKQIASRFTVNFN